MSRRPIRFALSFVVVAALATTSIAFASTRVIHHKSDKGDNKGERFFAHLSGYSEVPSLNSTGQGDLSLKIKDGEITFDLTYSGLSGPPSDAHVHIGQPGVSGGVSFFFCGGGRASSVKPPCPAGTSGEVTGTVTAADVIGPTAQGFNPNDLDSVVKAIEAGVSYAN